MCLSCIQVLGDGTEALFSQVSRDPEVSHPTGQDCRVWKEVAFLFVFLRTIPKIVRLL